MVAVKDLAQSAQKWTRNAGAASSEYATNAEAAASRWQSSAVAAQGTYQQAISAPGVPQRYARGVQRAGSEKYSRRVRDLGASRYVDGVSAAQSDWQSGFQPYSQALTSLTLSPRRPRGDRANLRRVEEVSTRLNALRLSSLGGGS